MRRREFIIGGVALTGSSKVAESRSIKLLVGAGTSFALPIWKAGKAAVVAGQRNAKAGFIGTSLTMGAFSAGTTSAFVNCRALSYPSQVIAQLQNAIDQAWGGTNATYTGSTTISQYDPSRFPSSANWAGLSGLNALGGKLIDNTTTTDPLTFAPSSAIDTLETWTTQGAGFGILTIDNGGVPFVTINEGAGGSLYLHSTSPIGSLSANSLNFKRVSGNIFIGAFAAYNSAIKVILPFNSGWSGSTAANWNDSSAVYSPIPAIKALGFDILVFEIGANDWATLADLATFQTSVQAVIIAQKTFGGPSGTGGDMVLMSSPPSAVSVASVAVQQTYINVLALLARTNGLNFINNTTIFGSEAQGAANGYYNPNGGGVHLNGTGYGVMAQAPLALLAA